MLRILGFGFRVQGLGFRIWGFRFRQAERGPHLFLDVEQSLSGDIISQKVFIKACCTCQFPHKSVNSSFISVIIKDPLADLCGN